MSESASEQENCALMSKIKNQELNLKSTRRAQTSASATVLSHIVILTINMTSTFILSKYLDSLTMKTAIGFIVISILVQ